MEHGIKSIRFPVQLLQVVFTTWLHNKLFRIIETRFSISILVTNREREREKKRKQNCAPNSVAPSFFYFFFLSRERLHLSPGMFYLRFIGAVRFHKSWDAPTAKYSCPQLHARTVQLLRAQPIIAHYPPIVAFSSDITRSQECIPHYVRYICLQCIPSNLLNLSEISNHDPFVKYRNSFRIRLDYFVLRFSAIFFLPFSFLFFWPRFDKARGSHKASVLSEERVSNTIFFFFPPRICSLLNINPGPLQEKPRFRNALTPN